MCHGGFGDLENCLWNSDECYYFQDTCNNAELGKSAVDKCDKTPAGTSAVFFVNFFVAGCIFAILWVNVPEFVEKVHSDKLKSAKAIMMTLYSVFSSSYSMYQGINVAIVLGCLADTLTWGQEACENGLESMESGTVVIILFSALAMIVQFTFACGLAQFGLNVNDENKCGLYFVHFFEIGNLIGCAIGLSTHPDCSPAFQSIIDEQTNKFINVIVFTVLFMVLDLLGWFGIDYAYVSSLCGFGAEEKKETQDSEAPACEEQDECAVDVPVYSPGLAQPVVKPVVVE